MNSRECLFNFENKYYKFKRHKFYKPKHREFLYDTIINNIYNTELILCINGIKPISRFIADKFEHIIFLKKYLYNKGLFLEYRQVRKNEKVIDLDNKINYIIYIGKDINLLKKVKDYEKEIYGDIGNLLGYPSCCSQKWNGDNLKLELNSYGNDTNMFFENYLNSSKYPLLNNPFLNFTSNSLSFFYPCSLDCKNSLNLHEKQANVIKNDNYDFYKNLISYFSLPILFSFPEKNNILTSTLHFDEIFRIYFIGFRKGNFIFYKDFFILSLAFLDQQDDSYITDSFKLLEKLIFGNKIYIKENTIIIEGLNYINKHKIKSFAKIINFQKYEI